MHRKLLSKTELEKSLHFILDRPYAVVTFHPVTLEEGQAQKQFGELLQAINMHPELKYIFTKANADTDGRIINRMMEDYAGVHKNTAVLNHWGTEISKRAELCLACDRKLFQRPDGSSVFLYSYSKYR